MFESKPHNFFDVILSQCQPASTSQLLVRVI